MDDHRIWLPSSRSAASSLAESANVASASWFVRLTTLVVARPVWISATFVMVLIILGCMSISLGEKVCETPPTDGVLEQSDTVTLPKGTEQDIYYPISYGHPPNLKITGECARCACDHFIILEQKEDHFRVRNTCLTNETMTWKARGLRQAPVGPPPPVVIQTSNATIAQPPPPLPQEPMPSPRPMINPVHP